LAEPVIDLEAMDLKAMRVSEMRRILEEQGEECLGCAEKADFVKKIEEVAKRQKRKA
jgi:mesencephalic astrocyte-derived neurotrophic factor